MFPRHLMQFRRMLRRIRNTPRISLGGKSAKQNVLFSCPHRPLIDALHA
jgi:hypothetical protein